MQPGNEGSGPQKEGNTSERTNSVQDQLAEYRRRQSAKRSIELTSGARTQSQATNGQQQEDNKIQEISNQKPDVNTLPEKSAFADEEEQKREAAYSQSSFVPQDKNVEPQIANSLGQAPQANQTAPEKTEYEKMIEA